MKPYLHAHHPAGGFSERGIGLGWNPAVLSFFLLAAGIVPPTLAAEPMPGSQAFCGGNQPGPSFSPDVFPELPGSLKCVPVPQPYQIDANGDPTPANILTPPPADPSFAKTSTLPGIVKNKAALIALGKALFWDQQVGSDGMACASCHFNAGADNRVKNQINPGGRNASGEKAADGLKPIGDIFDPTYTAAATPASRPGQFRGPNYTLRKADFPFTRYTELADSGQPPQTHRNDPRQLLDDGITPNPDYGQSLMNFDTDDVASSAGVFHSTFNSLSPNGAKEKCNRRFPTSGAGVPLFNVGGIAVRQVEPRNSPTVINAVFNFRNFWDGRANNVFNGLDPFGARRPFPTPWIDTTQAPPTEINAWDGKQFTPVALRIHNASLASQAVGPALSDFEMSCGNKTFPMLGRKMLAVKPLLGQQVSKKDSVLGSYKSLEDDKGLNVASYANLIKAAFVDSWWNAPSTKRLGAQPEAANSGFTQMENNFSLFWGLAIAAYESTLVSDDSKYDMAQEGRATLSDSEIRGMNLFIGGKGRCVTCHAGPEFTAASVTHVRGGQGMGRYVQRMLMGDGRVALYDTGFYNIGVRPAKEDLGLGATDPHGYSLSFTRNAKAPGNADGSNASALAPDPFGTDTLQFDPQQPNLGPIDPGEPDAVDGAFKTPTLRNIELTGPYFHNGGYATLEQTIHFYNRGGDRRDYFQKNSDGSPALGYDFAAFAMLPIPDSVTGLVDSTGFVAKDSITGAPLSGYSSNLAPDMAGAKNPLLDQQGVPWVENLGLSADDVADLVAFLKSLTDERVRWERAPFDHPALHMPNGHAGDELSVQPMPGRSKLAKEDKLSLPAVGKNGRTSDKGPLQAFEVNLK